MGWSLDVLFDAELPLLQHPPVGECAAGMRTLGSTAALLRSLLGCVQLLRWRVHKQVHSAQARTSS